jgi:hypothetical protein
LHDADTQGRHALRKTALLMRKFGANAGMAEQVKPAGNFRYMKNSST